MGIALVSNRGGGGPAAVGTSVALPITGPELIARWNTLFLAVAVDNSGVSGAAPTLGITDPRGNVWTSRGSALQDPGLADEGVFVQLWSALVATPYQVGDVVTLTASPSTSRGAFLFREMSGVHATTSAPVPFASAAGSSSTPSVSITPTAAGQLVFGVIGTENNVNSTSDADTVNGTWQSIFAVSSNSGVAATSVNVGIQHKVVTAPGVQTWNPGVGGVTLDWAQVLAVLSPAPALTITPTYDADLSRVHLAVAGYPAGTENIGIVRFTNAALTNGRAVRGGTVAGINAATDTGLTVDDYEFTDAVLNTYRVTAYDSLGNVRASADGTITPALGEVWLKNIARPFLNRTVTVVDFGDVSRPARGGVLEVLGRRLPVAVTEVRGSRRYDLVVRAADANEVAALETFLSFGDTVFVQVPADCVVPGTGHFFVGDVAAARRGRHDTPARYFTMPLTECDAPDASIVGYTVTWLGVQAAWASWGALLADAAVPTWLDLLEYVSAPADEVVG